MPSRFGRAPDANSIAFAVAAIAVPRFDRIFGLCPHVGSERAADIVRFAELSLVVAADEALVFSGVDQFSLGHRTCLLSMCLKRMSESAFPSLAAHFTPPRRRTSHGDGTFPPFLT